MEKEKIYNTCPACKGSGCVEVVISKSDTNRPIAKKLIAKGHSVRKVAAMLGYKNPGSITNLLRTTKKKVKK